MQKEEKKRKEIEETYKVKLKNPEKPKELIPLEKEEVIRRLRARNVPITLFGEDDKMRAERLHELELKEPMELIPESLEGSTFLKHLVNEEDEEDIEVTYLISFCVSTA